jgi:hypothetical protein
MPTRLELIELLQGVIDHIVADLTPGNPDSILLPILEKYDATVDISWCEEDEEERVGVYYGDRGNPPDGLSIACIPGETEITEYAAPNMWRADYLILLRWYWSSPETHDKITKTPGKFWRLMTELTFGTHRLFGREALNAGEAFWNVADGVLYDPKCAILDPATDGEAEFVKRHAANLGAELEFTGHVLYNDPTDPILIP